MATTLKSSRKRSLPAASANGAADGQDGSVSWHSSAPAAVRSAAGWGAGSPGWAAWARHLARRSRPRPLERLFDVKQSPLLWGAAGLGEGSAEGVAEWLERLTILSGPSKASGKLRKRRQESADAWLAEPTPEDRPEAALECLAWAYCLPRMADALGAERWWAVQQKLVSLAEQACSSLPEQATVHQWLAGELPMALAYSLPEINDCRTLAASGWQTLSEGVVELLSDVGLPSADELELLRPLLAVWTRSRELARRLKLAAWDGAADRRFRRGVRQALRLTRRDGGQAFSSALGAASDRALFAAALAGAKRGDRRAGAAALAGGEKGAARSYKRGGLPSPSSNSEDAAVALLRRDWRRGSERLAVKYAGDDVRIELSAGDEVLFSGVWPVDVRFNDEPLAIKSPWREVCWNSDEDGDYLELELGLAGGVKVQRQAFLAREDQFLLLADCVLCGKTGAIEYRSVLPIAESIAYDPAGESYEGYLVGRKPRGLVFPLALPEWRAEASPGSLEANGDGLELQLGNRAGRRLYAPLLIDLDTRRMLRPATWRRLTVAENREIQPRDVAVGYRVQAGKEQWIVYRSLDDRGNRTLVGHNLVSEFLVARFDEGEVDPLIEVE